MKPLRLASFFLATATVFAVVAKPVAPAKPNLIVILMDDMGYGDIGPFRAKLNPTPNLDRVGTEGMKLASFYCAPFCSASRVQADETHVFLFQCAR